MRQHTRAGALTSLILFIGIVRVTQASAYTVASIPFQWDTFTGTPVTLGDNEVSAAIPLPFAFKFLYDAPFLIPYATLHIGSNGFITFLDGQPDGCTGQPPPCGGQRLPAATAPNGLIAGYWEDLNPAAGGTISYGTIGTAPTRVFIVQFNGVPHAPSGNPVSFQIKLFEGSNEIEIHCLSCPSDGGNHTQGIEGAPFDGGTQTHAYCYTTDSRWQYVYGYPCFDSQSNFQSERNAANFSLTNDAVRFTPPNNRTALAPFNYSPGRDNIINMRYSFRIETNNVQWPEGKLIYRETRLYNPVNYGNGTNTDTYLLNSFFRTAGNRYSDPSCYVGYAPPPDVVTSVPAGTFQLQIPDYPTKGFTGSKTDQPLAYPRETSLGAIDGIAAAVGLDPQFDVTGMDGTYELSRGGLITDKTGWHLVAANCDPQGHCTCQDAGLDPANPNHVFRQWDATITLGGTTYTTHAALPDDAATAITPWDIFWYATEYFFTNGTFKVYVWDIQVQRENAGTWDPLNQWEVTDHDGSTRYFGVKPTVYNSHCVIEVSNDPSKQSAYLFGATYGFATTTLDLASCAATPTVVTGAVTDIGKNAVTLNGIANANGGSGTSWFQYGLTTSYGSVSKTRASSGTADTAAIIRITGLSPNTTYHYRVVAQTNGGISYGSDGAVTTASR